MGIEVAPTLAVLLCLEGKKYNRAFRETMVIGLLATIISQLPKFFIYRRRPWLAKQLTRPKWLSGGEENPGDDTNYQKEGEDGENGGENSN